MKNNRLVTTVLVLAFTIGLGLLLYPKVSNYWNSIHSTKEVEQYISEIEGMDSEAYSIMLNRAKEYNDELTARENVFKLTDDQKQVYSELLNISNSGMMGYIDIPVIGVSLPVYHGTAQAVLQKAVGHLEWTSLPVGGEGTHCVLSGHRGLPSSKLFTDLDKVTEGDVFFIRVLDQVLTYEVDRILIVEPEDTSGLLIDPDKDYCTLVTCTPYAVNTHRILVRGHRIENSELASSVFITADAVQIEPLIVAPVLFILFLMIVFSVNVLLPNRINRRNQK